MTFKFWISKFNLIRNIAKNARVCEFMAMRKFHQFPLFGSKSIFPQYMSSYKKRLDKIHKRKRGIVFGLKHCNISYLVYILYRCGSLAMQRHSCHLDILSNPCGNSSLQTHKLLHMDLLYTMTNSCSFCSTRTQHDLKVVLLDTKK